MKNFLLLMACLLVACPLAAPPVSAQSASLVERVRAQYGEDTRLKARFVQHISSDFLETEERYAGVVWIAGNRYRIETGSQTIVSDGELTWIHNIAESQVLINAIDDTDDGFSLTSFLAEFDTAYTIEVAEDELVDGQRQHVLQLAPTDAFASFKTVTMWIRPSDLAVLSMHVVDLNDVSMRFMLSEVDFGLAMAASSFTFNLPDGVEVIDLR